MKPITIATDRLLLKLPTLEDAKAMNQAVAESQDRLKTWMSWAFPTPTLKETEAFIKGVLISYQARLGIQLCMWRDGEFLGNFGFNEIDWENNEAKIGYWCTNAAEGKGYVSESVKALTWYGIEVLGLTAIYIICEEGNLRSQSVAIRCGFELDIEADNKVFCPSQGTQVNAHSFLRTHANGLPKPKVVGGWERPSRLD